MKVLTMFCALLLIGGIAFAQEKPETPVVKDKMSTTDGATKVKTTTKKAADKAVKNVQEAPLDKKSDATVKTVDASCGTCQFGMKGAGCFMAVKMNDIVYPVEGVDIHDHDAHGEKGLCNAVRKAEISGEIVDGKFEASSFKLLPVVTDMK